MQVNWRNENFAVSKNIHVSGVNGKLKQVNYFIRAWSRNEAIREAINEFEWEHPYKSFKIVDIRVQLLSEGGKYERNYYKVTIIYTNTKEENDGGYSNIPFLP